MNNPKIILFWGLFFAVFSMLQAQMLQINLDAPWNNGTVFLNTSDVEITGEALTTYDNDSLLNVYYRPTNELTWRTADWSEYNKTSGKFVILIKNLSEGYYNYEISLTSQAEPQISRIYVTTALVVDLTPPWVASPVQIVTMINPDLSFYYELQLPFSEPISQWDHSKLNFKIGNIEVNGNELKNWQPVNQLRWKAQVPENVARVWLDSLSKGYSLNGTIEPEAIQDLAGNWNPQALTFPVKVNTAQVVMNFQLNTPAVSPNGDGINDTLFAQLAIKQPATVFMTITAMNNMEMIYKNALYASPWDGQLSATNDSLLMEISDGYFRIAWGPKENAEQLPDGRYILTVYAQLPNALGYLDFNSLRFFVDRTPPVIGKLLPATGSPTHFIDAQPHFRLWPDQDTTQAPTIFCSAQFTNVVNNQGETLDTLNVVFEWDSLNNHFFYDFKQNHYTLLKGQHTVLFTLTDRAGNTGVYSHNFTVVEDTTVTEILDVYNYPNPFNPFRGQVTNIAFFTYLDGDIQLQIFDFTGALVYQARSNPSIFMEHGRQMITWDGRDLEGKVVPAGVYWGQITIGDQKSSIFRIAVRNQ